MFFLRPESTSQIFVVVWLQSVFLLKYYKAKDSTPIFQK